MIEILCYRFASFVKSSAYLLTNSYIEAVNASPKSSETLRGWRRSKFIWLLCYSALKWSRGLTAAQNLEVFSVSMHHRFIQEAVLDGFQETYKLV